MSKKNFEDLIFYQNRLSKGNKKNFRDFILERAGELGLRSENYPRFGGQKNVVIGDLSKLKNVIVTNYDTPVKMPAFVMKSSPLSNIIIAISSLIIALILIIAIPKMFYLGIPFILLAMYSYGWLGGASRFNFNSTSGILCLLDLMEEVGTINNKIAYAFLDNHFKGFSGAKAMNNQMTKDDLITIDRKIIIIDKIGYGNNFVLDYFRETKFVDEIKEALESSKIIKAKVSYHEATNGNTTDHFAFKKFHHVAIRAYTSRNNKGFYSDKMLYKNDRHITLSNVDYVVSGMKAFIAKKNIKEKAEQVGSKKTNLL